MLTAKLLKSLKPKDKAYRVSDGNRTGFGVQVCPGGTLTFFLQYRYQGKRRYIRLGRFDEQYFSLKEARALAHQKRSEIDRLISERVDPEKHDQEPTRRSEDNRGSLEQLLEVHLAKMRTNGRTEKHIYNVERAIRQYMSKELLGRKVVDVTIDDLRKLIAKPIKAGKTPASRKLRTYLRTLFQTALDHDNDPANIGATLEFGITTNPVDVIPNQKGITGVRNRELSFEEIGRLWRALTHPDVPGSEVLKAQLRLQLLLAGMHFTEIGHARWSEFDMENRIWEIPAKRGPNQAGTKNGRRFILPICDMAFAELQSLRRWSGHSLFLFPHSTDETRPMPYASPSQYVRDQLRPWMDTQDRAAGLEPLKKWTPANFRSTVKTRLGQLGYNNEQRNRLQNHGQSGVDVRHYDRWDFLDEKREILDKWERSIAIAAIEKPV